MKCKLLCKLKGLFGIYTPGCEYWIDLKDIDIPINFLRHHPRQEKMEQKWAYYRQTGEFESQILLNRNFELVDGYTSYIIAKTENLHKVPVYFVDQMNQKFYLEGENTYWEVNIYVQNVEKFMILIG